MAEDDAPFDLDRILDEIRAEVASRTASGEYPATIDEELRSHVIDLGSNTEADVAVAQAIASVAEHVASTTAPVRASAAGSLRRVADAARARQVTALAAHLEELGTALVVALTELESARQAQRHEVDSVQDRLADVERALRHVRGGVDELLAAQADLLARVERLERRDADRG